MKALGLRPRAAARESMAEATDALLEFVRRQLSMPLGLRGLRAPRRLNVRVPILKMWLRARGAAWLAFMIPDWDSGRKPVPGSWKAWEQAHLKPIMVEMFLKREAKRRLVCGTSTISPPNPVEVSSGSLDTPVSMTRASEPSASNVVITCVGVASTASARTLALALSLATEISAVLSRAHPVSDSESAALDAARLTAVSLQRAVTVLGPIAAIAAPTHASLTTEKRDTQCGREEGVDLQAQLADV